jgi:hypothetical protein
MPLLRPATRAPLVRGVARLVLLGVCAVALAAPSAHAQGVLSLEASPPADAPSASASPAPRDDPQEALLAVAACMREHGVDMPDPALGGTGPAALPVWDAADPAAQDAHDACGPLVGGPTDSSEPFEGPDPS